MPMKIFGIGLNKTGTTTLGACLQGLGYRHMSCRRDLLVKYRHGDLDPIFSVTDAFDSFDDWPWPLLYRELLERYGAQARFVLTKRRSAETWLGSLKKHALITHPKWHCRELAYGYAYPFHHERAHLDFYDRHNREVVDFFAAQGASDQLLTVCWEDGDGQEKIAAFLGYDPAQIEIPHANPAKPLAWFDIRQLHNRWNARYWATP